MVEGGLAERFIAGVVKFAEVLKPLPKIEPITTELAHIQQAA
jgi:hypothetical protein